MQSVERGGRCKIQSRSKLTQSIYFYDFFHRSSFLDVFLSLIKQLVNALCGGGGSAREVE